MNFRVVTLAHEPVTLIHSYVSQLDPNEEKNVTWFDFSLDNPGKYMFTLFVNGTPVDDKTITVKPEGNVMAWMECNPDVISLGESTTCLIHLELRSNETVTLNFKKVEFGGKKVWPNGPSSINVPVNATTLNLTNMREYLTVTITINNELADYYFNKKPLGWGSYIDRLAGYSYLIRVFFDDNVVTSDIIEIMGKSASLGEKAKVTFEVIGTTYSVSQRCVERLGQLEIVIGGSLGSALAKVTPVVDMISWGLTLRDFISQQIEMGITLLVIIYWRDKLWA